jgi:hypothetical protein
MCDLYNTDAFQIDNKAIDLNKIYKRGGLKEPIVSDKKTIQQE